MDNGDDVIWPVMIALTIENGLFTLKEYQDATKALKAGKS